MVFYLNIPDDEDWLILGDFNFIRYTHNRNKPRGNAADMMLFNDFIREQNLTELPIKGRAYTWSNMQADPLLEQLDWFFTSLHWTSSFPNTVVNPQGKPTSDHILVWCLFKPPCQALESLDLKISGLHTQDS